MQGMKREKVLMRREVAEILRVSIQTVDRLRKQGKLRALPLSTRGAVRFSAEDVDALLNGRPKAHKSHMPAFHS